MLLQKLFYWFDNETHPIVVRQIRRFVRSHTIIWTTILFLVIAVIPPSGLMLFGMGPVNEFSMLLWTVVVTRVAVIFITIAAFCPAIMYGLARINDELLDCAFSWHKLLFGYILLGILLSGYYAILASLSIISLYFVFGGHLFLSLRDLLQAILWGIVNNILVFSFLVKVRSMTGLVLTTIMLFFFHSTPLIVLVIVQKIISFRFKAIALLDSNSSAPAPSALLSNIQLYDIVAWFILGILAFWLCRSHFLHPKRASWQDICINLLAYGIFTFMISAFWAVLQLNCFV
ncbi:MAG: hypothetical protein LBI18_15990 [Planctomycetaceae bacterium]|jgi:hypothetical protein|nr:hypothetical protein [Planctomycetaceae bacterium]